MKRIMFALLILCSSFCSRLLAKDERIENLSVEHRRWLEEEVVYIITDKETDLFLSLSTAEERDRFIEVFWQRRDPNPATLENEFRTEHNRRIAFANRQLGRETTRPGWATDQGRYYIILGEPQERQRYIGQNEVVECEIWFYEGDTELRLPPHFNLLFFRENNLGEYKLYHPWADGPQRLMQAGHLLGVDQNKAVDLLETVSMDLARASLTVDLTEMVSSHLMARNSREPQTMQIRPPMGLDRTLADITESPKRLVSTDYIDAYLRYGSKVSAEYSFRFVPNRQYFSVLFGPQSTPFVHYSIELDPENFSLEANEEGTRFYTTLDVSLEVKDEKDTLIALNDATVFLELTASQMEQAQSHPMSYQDDFPLAVPGDYKVGVTLRNRVNKQFTVAEGEIHVPDLAGQPGFSDILVGYQEELVAGSQETDHLTFQVGSSRVYPATEKVFPIGETVHVLAQVVGAGPEHSVRLELRGGEAKLRESEKKVEAYPGGLVIEKVSLLQIGGGNYELLAQLLDPSGSVVAQKSTPLTVSPRSSIPRPRFVYRRGFNTRVPGLLPLARGQQLLLAGRLDEALRDFEEAVAAENPDLPMARWKLAGALIYKRDADRALGLLMPLEAEHPDEYEVVEGLGFAYYIKKDYSRAVSYFEKAMGLRAPDTIVLNALGDSLQELGRSEEAKKVFERSLQLNPEQAGVKQRIESLSEVGSN